MKIKLIFSEKNKFLFYKISADFTLFFSEESRKVHSFILVKIKKMP